MNLLMKFRMFPVLLVCVATAWAQTPAKKPLPPETDRSHDGWFAEMPPALAQAKKTGMDMLIDFGGSDWCMPCKWLKENILTKPEFNQLAAKHFVLVDIDTLARGLSPERKARYIALQKQYRVGTFPSIFLTTPEGEPYAWTTYIPAEESHGSQALDAVAKQDKPEAFWAQIQPLIARGKIFREGLAKSANLAGLAKADALIDALSQVREDFLLWYYPARVEELRTLDPTDHRGFLAHLDGLKAYTELEEKIGGGYDLNPAVTVADVDALIAKFHLQGETLQQALAMKATLLIRNGEAIAALECLEAFAAAQDHRGQYDRGDYMPITAATLAQFKKHVAEGLANRQDVAAQYYALHQIFENGELPDRYKISCHATVTVAFQPKWAVRKPIADTYGKALLAATAGLQGEARARALAKGLENSFFLNVGALRTTLETVAELVGWEKAVEILPEPYKGWLPPPPANSKQSSK